MHHSIEPHELTQIDLASFEIVQVSDGTHTVVLWEAHASPHVSRSPDDTLTIAHLRGEVRTLTIRLCDPLNPVRRKDVCERLQAHLAASRAKLAPRAGRVT